MPREILGRTEKKVGGRKKGEHLVTKEAAGHLESLLELAQIQVKGEELGGGKEKQR